LEALTIREVPLKTKVLRCNLENLIKAADIIKKGGIIVYPTDTVYGLGCNPYDRKAVEKIFRIKGRDKKPLPILVAGFHEAFRLAKFTPQALKIAEKLWPGALTLVLEKKHEAPAYIGGDPKLIGLRIPNNNYTCWFAGLCGGAIVGTSANLSGQKPARTAEEAQKTLNGKVDLILDGGRTPLEKPSTVLDLTGSKPKILRVGAVSQKEIFRLLQLRRAIRSQRILRKTSASSSPKAF
jgi:L-threonylcarbamoyladenylate synthase